ncbi:MAG: protein of unknown function DUF1700 [Myoviridae sp. ctThM1]|nr:MAG: protein of unknown function DUF1700 [Myoviridae sp. ctThM1]
MNREEFREALYSKVDGLPAEYAIKYVISDLIDEIYDLKKENQSIKELLYWCAQDIRNHGFDVGGQVALARIENIE